MTSRTLALCGMAAAALLLSACQKKEPEVSYSASVEPLIKKYCQSCHMPGQLGYDTSGLDVSSYETLMKGTKYGAVVLPGDALTSTLVVLVEGRADPSIKMPHAGAPQMTQPEIEIVRRWVEQGAKNN